MTKATHTPGSLRASHAIAEWMGETWSEEFHHRMAAMIESHTAASELLGALEMADAALFGANMDMAAVERKVRAAIAKARGSE